MAVPPPSDKQRLRTELRRQRQAHRAALVADDRLDAAGAAIATGLLATVTGGAVIALYDPCGDEAGFPGLAELLIRRHHRLALPALDRPGEPRFGAWRPGDPLEPGPFGTRQPGPAAPTMVPDLIVAPLVAFDRRGTRLGQGGGHYDRLFARHPAARRIGCGWSVQEVAALPLDRWDVPLHAVVTERSYIACGTEP